MTRYEGMTKDLLHRFKFHDKTSWRHAFQDIIGIFLTHYSLSFDRDSVLIPIPLHPVRLRERGYDQALLLANAISAVTELPVLHSHLIRVRNTPHQTGLNQKERFTNISGAFKIKTSSTVRNKKIILVDDLLTTGATVNEAAKALKAGGADKISVLTLAIT
jgi:competence protein ComFC